MLEQPLKMKPTKEQLPPKKEEAIFELQNLFKNVSERAEKRHNLLSAIDELYSLSELIPQDKRGRPQTAIDFIEKTKPILEKFEALKDFKPSPSEKIRIAKADNQIAYKLISKILNDINYEERKKINDAMTRTQVDIRLTLAHFTVGKDFAITREEYQEYKNLKNKESTSEPEKNGFLF